MFKEYMNENFIGFCVVRKANLTTTKAGKLYADLLLFDGSEQASAKIWDYSGEVPDSGTVIKIEGTVSEYNSYPQVTISRWRKAKAGEFNPADFMPVYEGDRDTLVSELLNRINEIEDVALQCMVREVIEEKYPHEFYDAPAASGHHHNYLGGLLEHTVSVTKIALFLADNQTKDINRDIVIAGAILHDIGKIQAYDWSGYTISYSDDGKMVDHIPLGMMMLRPFMDKYLDNDIAQHLLHILVSHHGLKEWGSPVEPNTQEAKIIHLADLADARLNNK